MNADTTDIADAVARRAISRTAAIAAVGACALAALSLLFLVMADGRLVAQSIPQLVVLGVAELSAMVIAARAASRLRALRTRPGTGPDLAATTAGDLSRALVVTLALAAVAALICVMVITPRDDAAFSAVLGLALVAQLLLALSVARSSVARAATATESGR